MDENALITYVNKKGFDLFGYSREDVEKGLYAIDLIADEDKARARENIGRIFKETDIGPSEYHLVCKDGKRVQVLLHSKLEQGVEGNGRKKVCGIIEELTDLKAIANITLMQRDLGIKLSSTSDLELIFKYCVDAALEITGCDAGGIYKVDTKGNFELMYQLNIPQFMIDANFMGIADSPHARVAMKGEPVYIERLNTKLQLGSMFEQEGYMSFLLMPVKHDSEVIAAIVVASRKHDEINPIARKAIEYIATHVGSAIDRASIEHALGTSEKKYRHLFETSPYSVVIVDDRNRIVDCNLWTKGITGYEIDEFLGKDIMELPIFTPGAMEQLLAAHKELVAGKELLYPVDVQIKRKNGQLLWVSIAGTIIHLEKKAYLQVITWDITPRKQAAEFLEKENMQLKEIDVLRKDFITTASHELKTPLATIYGAVEFLNKHFPGLEPSNVKNLVELIHRGSSRLKILIENLLDFSRIESNRLTITRERLDIVELVRNVVLDVKYMLDQRELSLVLNSCSPGLVLVMGDKFRIEQVVINLLSNASKNTMPQGTVVVSVQANDKFAVISVEDTGIGFMPDELDKIFTKFGKLERDCEGMEKQIDTQGTGLGLYLSKNIIEMHGGKITVESSGRNKGSKFSVMLPLSTRA